MNNSTKDTLHEDIITRLEAGESIRALTLEFLSDDLALAIIDDWAFLKAQSLDILPNKSGLESVLKQSALLSTDDEGSWGAFSQAFKFWKLFTPAALAVMIVSFGIYKEVSPSVVLVQPSGVVLPSNSDDVLLQAGSVDFLSNQDLDAIESNYIAELDQMELELLAQVESSNLSAASSSRIISELDVFDPQNPPIPNKDIMEVGQLSSQWENEFKNELAEFYEIEQNFNDISVEPDTLFS